MSWTGFLLAYFLGGITFIPLVIVCVLAHAHCTFPRRLDARGPSGAAATEPDRGKSRSRASSRDDLVQPGDDVSALGAVEGRPEDAGMDSSTSAEKDQQPQYKPRNRTELDVATGFFAVCREYTPMGINAKPIERSTPIGSTTVATPSQSVYQAMYRTIFERKQAPGPLGDKSNLSQRPKKAGNVFYVVLRHGHLMLFDDEGQLEVRHVISLAHHDVSIYSGGGDVTPEGELWIKRSAICLSRKKEHFDKTPDSQSSKPFYLFSENCSAKEDFYFALLRNQDLAYGGDGKAPAPLALDVQDMLSLMQRLHSTEDHLHTRWLNALIGRIFLSINRTADFENFVREKLTTKISRVKKPTFLSDISIRDIDPGDSAPWIMNPRLRDLNVEGECVVEADVRYTGNFRIEVATTARIDLGARFKVREVDLVLAVVLRRIEGHMLFKVKPPPSNRIWQTFQTMPKIEMTIEPIVSTRQITYTVILRQIENRIKEVLAETMVLPFWDDTPFFRTEHKRWRGGIFESDDAMYREPAPERLHDHPKEKELGRLSDETGAEPELGRGDLRQVEKSHSLPNLDTSQSNGFFNRKGGGKKGASNLGANAASSTSLVDSKVPDIVRIPAPPPPQSPCRAHMAEPAKPVIATANVEDDGDSGSLFSSFPEAMKPVANPNDRGHRSKTSISSTSSLPPSGLHDSLLAAPSRPRPVAQTSSHSSSSSSFDDQETRRGSEKASSLAPNSIKRRDTASSSESAHGRPASLGSEPVSPSRSKPPSIRSQRGSTSGGSSIFGRRQESAGARSNESNGDDAAAAPNQGIAKRTTLASMTNAAVQATAQATAQARQWGWNAIQRRKEQQAAKKSAASGHGSGAHNRGSSVDLSQPMGGGRPFPPPGTPLPGPETPPTKIAPSVSNSHLSANHRPSLPPRSASSGSSDGRGAATQEAPRPSTRRRLASTAHERETHSEEILMVVAAPEESRPTTPVSESADDGEEDDPKTPQTAQGTKRQEEEETMTQEEIDRDGTRETTQVDPDEGGLKRIPTPPLADDELGVRETATVGGIADDDGYSNWLDD